MRRIEGYSLPIRSHIRNENILEELNIDLVEEKTKTV
jgi:hypothetical protein